MSTGEPDGEMSWQTGLDPVSTTDKKALTGDPPCLIGGQEHNHIGYVV